MQMKLNDSGEKITSEEIRSFEQDFSIVLPEDYKSFLEESNGGMPDGDYVFEFFDEFSHIQKAELSPGLIIQHQDRLPSGSSHFREGIPWRNHRKRIRIPSALYK